MVKVFETLAEGGVIRLPADAPPSAHCVVTILHDDIDTLREQAASMIPQELQEKMSELLAKSREGALSEGESDELDALAQEFDRATLIKGRALAALAQLNDRPHNG